MSFHPDFKFFCLADQLEVIHVNTEDQLERLVEEQALPSGDGLKVALQELVREVVLPVFPRHGVSVQRQAQLANWPLHPSPGRSPLAFGEFYPSDYVGPLHASPQF